MLLLIIPTSLLVYFGNGIKIFWHI